MDLTLTWTTDAGPGEWSGSAPVVLGREGDVEITDDQVSRRHARLDAASGTLTLTDLGSANGTFVNDERIESAPLPSGGTVRLGRVVVEITVHADETVFVDAEPPPADETVVVDDDGTVVADSLQVPLPPSAPDLVIAWTNTETDASAQREMTAPVTIGSRDDADLRLADGRVSRRHAVLHVDTEAGGATIRVEDQGSSNGTFHEGQRITSATLGESGTVRLGPYRVEVRLAGVEAKAPEVPPRRPAAPPREDEDVSISLDGPPEPVVIARDFPPALFDEPVVPVEALRADGRPVQEASYVAIGGGLGNFVWVDMLRIGGVPPNDILVLGLEEKPHSRYERLCINSQIPDHERLRSDSGSCPDCIWGWP
ncbi:MAG: FHA domain-containing protein, partial [Bacteroidota bacterium]